MALTDERNRVSSPQATFQRFSRGGTPATFERVIPATPSPQRAEDDGLRGGFPNLLDVGTSGQRSLVGQMFDRASRMAREQDTATKVPEKQPFQVDTKATAAGVTPTTDPLPNPAMRGGSADRQATTLALGANSPNFTAREAGNGLFRVDQPGRSPLYTDNVARGLAEQDRGGFMSVDLAGSNAGLARANAIRESALGGDRGGPRGGVIGNSGPAETNAMFSRWGLERALRDPSLTAKQRDAIQDQANLPLKMGLEREKLGAEMDMKRGDQALKAQELAQLDAMGLRKDALGYAQLEQGDRQFQAGAGLRQAQTLNNLAEASSRLTGRQPDLAKGVDAMRSSVGMLFGDDKKGAEEFMSRYATSAVTLEDGSKVRFADLYAQDPARALAMLPNTRVTETARKYLSDQLGQDISAPNITGGLRGPRASDPHENFISAPVKNMLGLGKVIDTDQGPVPLSAFEDDKSAAYLGSILKQPR